MNFKEIQTRFDARRISGFEHKMSSRQASALQSQLEKGLMSGMEKGTIKTGDAIWHWFSDQIEELAGIAIKEQDKYNDNE